VKPPPRKLLLKNFLSPGDIVLLTAAVRDFHLNYPGRFVTDVRTSCPELWEHNPYLTPLREGDPDVEAIHCHYPLINRCNEAPYHCLHGFIDFLNQQLHLSIKPTVFRGDIHLSEQEKLWYSQVRERTGEETPFWIVVAGGKFDVTIKWWDIRRFQEVVDHFRRKIQFVQVGEDQDYHPPLNGVIDLRGQTDLRQLVRLVHHAQGVLCPVTCLMHLAAAVPTRAGQPSSRPCVVVAGGREPVHWEAYPTHQFIHTMGALPCCETGGCWKCRTVPLGDGNERDAPGALCVNVVGDLPRCMDMIISGEVIRRIETYFDGGVCRYLTPRQARAAWPVVSYSTPKLRRHGRLTEYNARIVMERFLDSLPAYPGGYRGRGVVICAGGVPLLTNAWVCLRMLRRQGCDLPIELWHLGKEEMDPALAQLVRPFGVRCVDAFQVRKRHPARILRGWGIKPYALLHCRFREALLLDADNVSLVNPEFLFETAQFQRTGAIFWPDLQRWDASEPVWRICGVPFRNEAQFESGQIVVDKSRCWKALRLALWMNEHGDFFYEHIYGDKDTFGLAFRKLHQPWSMPSHGVEKLESTMCQHDFQGRRIFQHRNMDKWDLLLRNKPIKGFRFEAACRAFIEELRDRWDGRVGRLRGIFSGAGRGVDAASAHTRQHAQKGSNALGNPHVEAP
jgi:ADP-heptose:LPS heptosyltransferase